MRGRDKLLEDVAGEPLLARQLRISGETGAAVFVALPPGPGPRRRLAGAAGARALTVVEPSRGISASIAALAREAGRMDADALVLVLADMPELEGADLFLLLSEAARYPNCIVRAGTADGRPGHPVIFPRRLFGALQDLQGDEGARKVTAAEQQVHVVNLAGQRAVVDLDTPEAWAEWRSSR
jgi:CTP:molybdopterin cytidylyltransferase MocA